MTLPAKFLRPAYTIDADATARAAARVMRERHVGSLVMTSHGKRLGMLTDRDLALGVLAADRDPDSVLVCECATQPLVEARLEGSLRRALMDMRERGVHRLAVVDVEGQLVGILSADEALCQFASELGDLRDALRRGFVHEIQVDDEVSAPRNW